MISTLALSNALPSPLLQNSIYEAALLGVAAGVGPWRPGGLLPQGLPLGAGGLQLPGGLVVPQLPALLTPIQTLAWAQAQMAQQQQQQQQQGLGGMQAPGLAGLASQVQAAAQQQQQQQQQQFAQQLNQTFGEGGAGAGMLGGGNALAGLLGSAAPVLPNFAMSLPQLLPQASSQLQSMSQQQTQQQQQLSALQQQLAQQQQAAQQQQQQPDTSTLGAIIQPPAAVQQPPAAVPQPQPHNIKQVCRGAEFLATCLPLLAHFK